MHDDLLGELECYPIQNWSLKELEIVRSFQCGIVAKGNRPKGNKPYYGKKSEKSPCLPQNAHSKGVIPKKEKAKAMERKIWQCYNYGKKRQFAWDCPKPTNGFLFTKTLEIYVCSHVFVSNSHPQWIVNTRATKHIVHSKAGFMEFHHYAMGSWTIVLGNGSTKDVLGVGTHQLKLHRGNKLLLYNTIHALGMRCPWVSLSL